MSVTLRWVGLALVGILIAAAISIAASRLASQQIGLASEPISAGDTLAPEVRGIAGRPSRRRAGGAGRATGTTPASGQTSPAPVPSATPGSGTAGTGEPGEDTSGKSTSGEHSHSSDRDSDADD